MEAEEGFRMRKKKQNQNKKIRRAKSRVLHLFKVINSESVEKIITRLLELDRDRKRRPITIYINSGGGECSAGFALIDIMEKCKCPIKTIAIGEVASMAVPIFLAGTQGRRYISKHTFLMIHPLHLGTRDYLSFTKSRILNAEELEKLYDDYVINRSNLPKKIIDKAKTKEIWLNAKECLKYGLADREL